ncbi:hypothetical protein PVAP13_7KG106709 [Panicum virgatum]|uniref:Uncharacterized protein n=1 Tax=Panicum virgatum TaxID=38727 RepID=A0A8T0QJ92_PANVG|nr:hypothetical protein PVAP13_7KG106709 [Panicum virgatum]
MLQNINCLHVSFQSSVFLFRKAFIFLPVTDHHKTCEHVLFCKIAAALLEWRHSHQRSRKACVDVNLRSGNANSSHSQEVPR